ncbi:hypothetical protein PBI_KEZIACHARLES14_38 [Mycobacterium phage Keziacharles14]|nr:hypothetical protein PBI_KEZIACHARLES14_38 [Mycobacterium phage Keziacharles14]
MGRVRWLRKLFSRNWDRYPEWRPDQILTPENRSLTGQWHERQREFERALISDGWQRAGTDPLTGGPVYVRYREHG